MSVKQQNRPDQAASKAYADACRTALTELQSLLSRQQQLKNELSTISRDIQDRRALADHLLILCSHSDQRSLRDQFKEVLYPSDQEIAQLGDMTSKTLAVFEQDPEQPLRAADVQDKLVRLGLKPDPKAIFNAFQRLAEKGLITRVGRGRYRIAGYGIGISTSDNPLADKESR
jgi:hypothetical protein